MQLDEPTQSQPINPAPLSSEPLTASRMLVVGGSPERPAPELLRRLAAEADLVLACDAGADTCRAAGVGVDVLVGDADSATPEGLEHARAHTRIELSFPAEKDDTDLGLALRWVRERALGPEGLVLTGVTGGRPDHALAVLGLLVRNADLAPRVEENAVQMRVLSPAGAPTWEFGESDQGRTVSALALLGPAVVTERGLHWNLDRAELPPLSDLGVSNVIESPGASVTCHDGALLVIAPRERVVK